MQQPPGLIDPTYPSHVCKLKKAIYSFKQAPQAWYNELKGFLLLYRLVNSKSDTSLFVYRLVAVNVYFLVCVDDLIITRSDVFFISYFLSALSKHFSIMDLGDQHYFLSVAMLSTPSSLLTQHKCIRDLLLNTNVAGAKDVMTPISMSQALTLHDGSSSINVMQYHHVIGAFQYLAFARPHIYFTMSKLA